MIGNSKAKANRVFHVITVLVHGCVYEYLIANANYSLPKIEYTAVVIDVHTETHDWPVYPTWLAIMPFWWLPLSP